MSHENMTTEAANTTKLGGPIDCESFSKVILTPFEVFLTPTSSASQ